MSRIAYLCSSESWGGLEMNQLRNASWMKERGHEVVVICRKNTPIEEAALTENLAVLNIRKHRKYYDFSAGKKLAALLESKRITHLIIRDTRDMSVSVIAKRKYSGKLHLSYFMEMQLGVNKKGLLHTLRFRELDSWSCPLNWLADQVRTMTKFDQKKIHVIPSAIDLSRFSGQTTQQEARELLDLPKEGIIIGLSGRFDPFKGHLLLLEAVYQLNRTDIYVCFLGEPTKGSDSTYIQSIQEKIQDYRLQERVFIRPFRKDIEIFYKAIDLFTMASKAETFGMVTIEAMASGTPVIASKSGGSPEILGFGEFGGLFESGNAQSLSQEIEKMLSNSTMNQANLKDAVLKYGHTAVCQKVEAILGI